MSTKLGIQGKRERQPIRIQKNLRLDGFYSSAEKLERHFSIRSEKEWINSTLSAFTELNGKASLTMRLDRADKALSRRIDLQGGALACLCQVYGKDRPFNRMICFLRLDLILSKRERSKQLKVNTEE